MSQFLCVNHLLHVAAAVICFFSISVSIPISTQERPDACLVSNLLVAQDTGSGVRVSHKNSLPDSIQQSVTLPDDHLPSICGPHFSRCNMILVNDSAMLHSILVVPVQRGVALIPYVVINGSVQLELYHVLELSSVQIGDMMCQIMTLYDFSDSATRNVIGLCLNEVNIRRISIMIDFNNLSQSSLSRYIYDVPITLHLSRNLSNFVAITNSLPLCWEGLLNSLAYYFDQSSFGLFDVISEGSDPEEYTLYYGNGDVFVCSIPHQLVRVSEQNLIIYCENVTAEIDMCEFSGSSVYNVKFYTESSGGVPYYCSPDMSSYIMVSDKTVTFNSTINCTVPLMSNESIYSGDCIRNGNNVLFAVTTTIGNIYVFDLQQQGSVLLSARSRAVLNLAKHQVYNESILYTNGSSTIFYNTSCHSDPYRVAINHPYHLALHMFGDGLQPCSCHSQVFDSTTTEPGPGNEPSDNTTSIIVGSLTSVISVVLAVAIVGAVLALIHYKRSKICPRPIELSTRKPISDSQASTKNAEEVCTTFTEPTSSPKERVEEEEQGRSPGIGETGERGGEGRQEKVGGTVTEGVSTQSNGSSSNQSESATVDGVKLDLAQQSVDTSCDTLDQLEQVQTDSGTGTCCQENAWKNSEKISVVLASSQQNPYPGITISQPGARGTNERATSEENLTTQSPCNDVSEGARTSNFNSSLGNCGDPTTTPVECSDNRY